MAGVGSLRHEGSIVLTSSVDTGYQHQDSAVLALAFCTSETGSDEEQQYLASSVNPITVLWLAT